MREMTERDKKLRLLYGAAFLVLMAVETLIALYVHDRVKMCIRDRIDGSPPVLVMPDRPLRTEYYTLYGRCLWLRFGRHYFGNRIQYLSLIHIFAEKGGIDSLVVDIFVVQQNLTFDFHIGHKVVHTV